MTDYRNRIETLEYIPSDQLTPGSVPVGITRKGVDLEGRVVYSDPEGVKLFQSYPPAYQLTGHKSDRLDRIGNSVPPLFMEAIARHVRVNILELLP